MTKIEVTKQDILVGRQRDCRFCPVAIAMTRTCGRPFSVGNFKAWQDDDPYDSEVILPKKVQAWISRFDRSMEPHTLEPLAFRISLPAVHQ